MKNIFIMVKAELARSWSRAKLIVSVVLILLFSLLAALPAMLGLIGDVPIPNMEFSSYIYNVWKLIVPFAVFFFTAGIIASDIKNHWIRTLLIHSVSRQELVVAKFISVLISIFILMVGLGLIPVLVFLLSSGIEFDFSFLNTFSVTLLYLLEALLYIVMAVWLSCFIPGLFNVIILAGWMFLDSSIINGLLMSFFSDYKYFNIFSDFFFPSGFSESMAIISSNGAFPLESLLWGITGLTLFMTLSFWQINKIKIDVNSD